MAAILCNAARVLAPTSCRQISSATRPSAVRVKHAVSVILRKQLDNLGYQGEECQVSPGYARNYLIPKKLAMYATKENKDQYKVVLSEEQARLKSEERAKNRLRTRISAVTLRFARATADGNELYGAVTAADIVEQLANTDLKNLKISTSNVKMGTEGNVLATVGVHTVQIHPARQYPNEEFLCSLRVIVSSS